MGADVCKIMVVECASSCVKKLYSTLWIFLSQGRIRMKDN